MKKIISFLLAFVLFAALCACESTSEPEKFTAYYFDYFDTHTTIVGYEQNEEDFRKVCQTATSLLEEYHKLYTIYNSYEGVNNLATINKLVDGEHQEVKVDEKIIDLLLYAKEMYYETGGMMNVAMGSVLSIWHEYRTWGLNNPDEAQLPKMDDLFEASKHTDIESIVVDKENMTVYISDPLASLDVGAIAKGFAVEEVAKALEEQGVTGYILNVGGNVRTIGTRGDGTPWQVGIENPDTSDGDKPHIEYLKLAGQSLVTSGSYQRFYVVDGVSYHHIIDPETLMPGDKYRSVSVLCHNSGLADALSTALFNMSFENGLALIEKLESVEAMWVMPNGEQKYSSGFEAFTFEFEYEK